MRLLSRLPFGWGHRQCSETEHGYYTLPGRGQWLCSAIGKDCRLGFTAVLGCKLGSGAAQHHCQSPFRECSTFGISAGLAPYSSGAIRWERLCGCLGFLARLSGWVELQAMLISWTSLWIYFIVQTGHKGSVIGLAYWQRTRIRQNCLPSFLARHSHQFGSAASHSYWLGILLRVHCKQKHSPPKSNTGCYKPYPSSLSLFDLNGWAFSPVIPLKWDESWSPAKCLKMNYIISWMFSTSMLYCFLKWPGRVYFFNKNT